MLKIFPLRPGQRADDFRTSQIDGQKDKCATTEAGAEMGIKTGPRNEILGDDHAAHKSKSFLHLNGISYEVVRKDLFERTAVAY
jgi:hypothetical protein